MKPYYDDGNGRVIYHGDCREILPTLPKCDLVLTDPPYAEETHAGARGGAGDAVLVDFASIDVNYLRTVLALCGAKRWTIATMDWRHILPLEQQPPTGLRFVRFGVWIKPNGAPQFTGDRPATGWEAVGILHNAEGKLRWNGGGHHAVWKMNKEQNNKHPTQKPISLTKDFLRLFSEPGDSIIDPFMGSGTTLRAAKDLNLACIGIEIEEKYCEIAANRLHQEVFEFKE